MSKRAKGVVINKIVVDDKFLEQRVSLKDDKYTKKQKEIL